MNIGKRKVDAVAYVILTLGAILILFPMYITVVTTFKTMQESASSFFTLPTSFYLGNYQEVLSNPTLGYSYKNTIFVTFSSLFLEFLVMPPMAFAISRGMHHRSKLFKGLYAFFLLGIFLPFQVRMMPLMKLLSTLNMLHPAGLVLLYLAHATCESMFLYVGYLATVSTSLEEAAYIDGANTFTTFYKIILPLMTPILATVMIKEGLALWNDYMLPLIILNRSKTMWTLTLFQKNYQGEFNVDYNLSFACMVLCCLPVVLLYIILQKQIIGGLTSGAVKG